MHEGRDGRQGEPSDGGDGVTRAVAAIAAVTGISPTALGQLDVDEYNALVDALEHRWSHTDELLVAVCQLVDNLTRVTAAAHGGQRAVASLGRPFRYPRPGEKSGPTVMRPRDIAAQMMRG